MSERIAIVGSRDFPHLDMVRRFVWEEMDPGDEVVSGGARGVDAAAAAAAREYGVDVKEFPADWSQGRGAGFARNQQIVDYCDWLVAFWDGESRGTIDTVNKARAAGKHVELYNAKESKWTTYPSSDST